MADKFLRETRKEVGDDKDARRGFSENRATLIFALAAGFYWTWWDSFHEMSRFSERLFGPAMVLPVFQTDVFISCVVKPLGVVVGCLIVAAVVRRRPGSGVAARFRLMFGAVALQAVLHVVYYWLLEAGCRDAAFLLYGVLSLLVVPVILQLMAHIQNLGERRVVAVIMGALAVYGIVNNLLFPMVLLGSSLLLIGTVYAAILGLAVVFLLLAGPPVCNDDGEMRTVKARTPIPLGVHLVIYGAVFGMLHILEGLIQTGPFSINLGVFLGCLVTIGLLAVLFFVMGNNHEVWSKMRSTVFPLAITGYLLIPLASNSDLALAFTEAGNLLYLAFLFIGCCVLGRRTAVDIRLIVSQALLFNNLGAIVGVLFAVNFVQNFAPGTQEYFALSVAVTALLTAATFWVGTDEQIRKIWGLRRKLSAKHYNDLVTKAKVRKLAEVHSLTPRESDILLLIAQGRRAPEMIDSLGVSMGTVRTHVKHLYAKLGVHSYAEAVRALEEVSLDEGDLQD